MAKRLEIRKDDVILEPSAGEGIFIDEILKTNFPVQIDALDIDKTAISILKKKYSGNHSITVRETDTLLDERPDTFSTPEIWLKKTDTLVDGQLNYFGSIGGHYDKVIGNPPYGAWQDYKKRELLKHKYPGQYVKETYTLFLLRCISVLKMGGCLSFIIPDTYMFLNLHSKLREILLTSTKIKEIITFPSKFFPGVHFGYSNLSIITLERCARKTALNNTVRIVKNFQSVSEFRLLFGKEKLPSHLSTFILKQSDILNCEQHRFLLASSHISDTINKAPRRLGDVANIVTGFYTGDNRKFVRALDDRVKGSKNYNTINLSLVFPCTSVEGIKNISEGYVPYIKSAASTRYYKKDDEWFVRWDEKTIQYYSHNKKTRFQNSSFYFQTGVAIPMVKSSNIRAFLLKDRVFDQSIVGIFPKEKSKLYYILALMNSDVINELVHIINPTANNSANYIKQLPYLEPKQETMDLIENKVKMIIKNYQQGITEKNTILHQEINELIEQIYT